MMRERREMLDSTYSRSSRREMILHDEGIEEKERYRTEHLDVGERGLGGVTMRGYEDRQVGKFSQSYDQGYPVRDHDTALKFQWTNLLNESGNSVADGREREGGYRGSEYAIYGRKYDGIVEKSIPAENEMVSNSFRYGHNVGSAEYYGDTRNLSSRSVEDPNYRGYSRNVADLPAEDARYYRHARSMTDFPIKDDVFKGNTRKATGLSVEDDEHRRHARSMTDFPIRDDVYSGCTRKATGLSVEDDEHRRHSRTARTDLPIEEANYQRGTRNVASPLVEDRQRCLAREHPGHMDRGISMRSYDERSSLRFRYEDRSRSLTPRSHSNGQLTPNQGTSVSNLEGPHSKVFNHLADGRGTGRSISPSNRYGSLGIVYSKANTSASPVPHKGINYPREDYDPNMCRHVDCTHQDSQRSGKIYRRPMSPDIYDNYETVQDYHDHEDPFGYDTLDPASPRHDYIGNSCNYDHTLEEEPMVHMDDVRGIRHDHKMEYGGANLQSMNRYLSHEIEAVDDTMLNEEGCHHEMDSYGMPTEDEAWTYPTLAEGALCVNEDAQQRLQSEDIDFYDQPKRMTKRKRGFIGKTRLPKHKTSSLGGRGALSYDNRYSNSVPESESVYPSSYSGAVPEDESVYNRSSSRHFRSKANARMSKTDSRLPFGGLSKELQSRLSKPCESGNISVKKRLNPRFVPRQYGPKASKILGGKVKSSARSSLNIKYTTSSPPTYGQGQRTSVKKRLKAAPQMDVCPPQSEVSHLGLNSESQDNLDSKISGTAKEAGFLKEADPDHSILKVKPTEDPPNDSEELKRLVDHWFKKCMLYLNANPGRVKKFKEQGKAGTLKCSICSSSKEFIKTKDVATHAFTSLKVGLRAPHLGFHRALCVLMGWDPAITSNGRWVCNSLPDVEARALKEDLILWPPVVIVHYGSAGDFFTNESVNISFEQLENTLREMGLSEGKITICHGKPGSPNIRLVKFNGTLSGLQEAERLHNIFSEKKHGRAELQEVDDGVRCSKESAQEAENKSEVTLYGYLGIVEDFDRLNYEMRRHSVAKSKKEILARANTAT